MEPAIGPSWRAVAILLGLGWTAALMLPVATFGLGPGEEWAGWAVLCLGWLGFLLGQFAWVANFLFAVALILLVRGRPPLVWGLMIGVLTSLLAAHALGFTRVYSNDGVMPVLAYGAGYYLWIGVVFLGGVALCLAALGEARQESGAAREFG